MLLSKKSLVLFSICASLFASSAIFQMSAQAAGNSLTIAVVDVQAAILQTNEGKAAKANIEKEIEQKRQAILAQENELKKLRDEIQAQQAILSDADKLNKQKEFEQKVQKYQIAQNSLMQESRQKELAATQQIYQKMMNIVKKIAKPKGYTIVMDKGAGALLYAENETDITNEVIDAFNKEYKAVASKDDKSAKK